MAACSLVLLQLGVSPDSRAVGRLYVKDALVSPNHEGDIEALLVRQEPAGEVSAGGEPLELISGGNIIGTEITAASGVATFHYTPSRKETVRLTVRTAKEAHVSATAVTTVAAWERRTPMLVVEMSALYDPQSREPLPDAADEMSKLTQFYYNAMYLADETATSDAGFRSTDRARQWLAAHEFPVGYIVAKPSAQLDWGAKIDELRAAGWTTIKVGIGRSRDFAETFLQRRLEVVIVPEPAKGSVPKKARIAKDWKEVRRKL
ncbi:MAG TPA: hypothetical protein VJ746_07280 [Nitrospira sp.]|nr:hypothetical protein [Nitrospira sp.]